MPRRFSEAEARRIFARAAEHQRADAPDDGLSLAELHEIGQAAGLDAAAIAAAVADVQAGVPDEPVTTFLGVRSSQTWSRVLPVDVTDAAWERMVAELRRTFKHQGNPSQIGRVREWTGGLLGNGTDGLRVALEPTEGGTRIVAEQTLRSNVTGLRALSGLTLAIPALTALLPLLSGKAEFWLIPLLILCLFAVIVALTAGLLRAAASKTERNVERLMDRFDLIARDAAPAPASSPAEGRLDAALLDAAAPSPDAAQDPAARRTRS